MYEKKDFSPVKATDLLVFGQIALYLIGKFTKQITEFSNIYHDVNQAVDQPKRGKKERKKR